MQVKKDNMMLSSKALIWCPGCGTECPERRDIACWVEKDNGVIAVVAEGSLKL